MLIVARPRFAGPAKARVNYIRASICRRRSHGRRRGTLNIAHRGASGSFPENTVSAFIAAVGAGADMCELDVQATHDGAVVVIHDETVDRTTDGHGAVREMTLAELKRLDAGVKFGARFRGERIPTLAEVVDAVRGRAVLNVELKREGIEREVCDILRAGDAISASMVSSFEWSALRRVRRIDPKVRVGLLAETGAAALVEAACAMDAWAVNPRFDVVNTVLCERAHARGLKVFAWTVDEPEAMRRLAAAGVDGIMTNYPERLCKVIKGR